MRSHKIESPRFNCLALLSFSVLALSSSRVSSPLNTTLGIFNVLEIFFATLFLFYISNQYAKALPFPIESSCAFTSGLQSRAAERKIIQNTYDTQN